MTDGKDHPSDQQLFALAIKAVVEESEEDELQAHVDACPACKERVAQLAYKPRPAPAASPELLVQIKEQIASCEAVSGPTRRPWLFGLLGIALVVALRLLIPGGVGEGAAPGAPAATPPPATRPPQVDDTGTPPTAGGRDGVAPPRSE